MGMTKTFILLAAMTALFGGVGYLVGGLPGMLVALGVATVINFISYWNADKIVLRMHNARDVSDGSGGPMERTFVRDVIALADRICAWCQELD